MTGVTQKLADRNKIGWRVRQLINKQFDILLIRIEGKSSWQGLGLDTPARAKLHGAVQNEFNIKISDEDWKRITGVGPLIKYLRENM